MRHRHDHVPRLRGVTYLEFLARMHAQLKPASYLEVGTRSGRSLEVATGASIAVDPAFLIEGNVIGRKPSCLFFQVDSDTFFRTRSPSALFGGPVELAFLDGLHVFEFLLRDFMNTEKHCEPRSVIALHDCVPLDNRMTARSFADAPFSFRRRSRWWTGDVWRLVPVLRTYRPDLTIRILDCPPTGLVLVTNLDPSSRVLDDAYEQIVAVPLPTGDDLRAYWDSIDLVSSQTMTTREQMLGG